MVVGLHVPESGDDLEAVVDGLAAASALTEYLPVFESGDDVFDTGPDAAVCPVVVIVVDPAGIVAPALRIGQDRQPPPPGAGLC